MSGGLPRQGSYQALHERKGVWFRVSEELSNHIFLWQHQEKYYWRLSVQQWVKKCCCLLL